MYTDYIFYNAYMLQQIHVYMHELNLNYSL